MKIWRLAVDSKNALGLIPADLDYFNEYFIGKPMKDQWNPPPFKIAGKSAKLREFVSWMTTAPVISEKAKKALEGLISPCAEILPLVKLRGKPYFALNVTCVVDCLDLAKSVERGAKNNFGEVYFDPKRIRDVPIFRAKGDLGELFVTEAFVDAVLKSDLQGAAFQNPAEDPFGYVLHRQYENDKIYVAKLY